VKTRKFATKAIALTMAAAMATAGSLPAMAAYSSVDLYGSAAADVGGMDIPGGMGDLGGGMDIPGGTGGDMGGGSAVPAAPPGGGSQSFYTNTATNELESKTYDGTVFADSTADSDVAVRVNPGVSAVLNGATVTKSAGDLTGDDSSFYGVNSGVLAYSEDAETPASLTITDSTVTTDGQGANGVFAYGDATISISNSTVTTTGAGGSGGIMVAGGGTLYAKDCTVTTEGGSSAAIRSDRGSGIMKIDGGTYVSNGTKGIGSPAIYCVADITVKNATLAAKNAQAICFEGRNPAYLYNCYLEGNYTASDDDENSNVMIYQSMSGDGEEGTSYFNMVGGVLKANNESATGNAKMFYTTNTYCYINLCNVEMVYSDTMDTFLLCACNTNERGWGTEGANGSECVLYTIDQEVKGKIIYDSWSYLGCYFTQGSVVESQFICREDNGSRGCDVYFDATSQWIVTGDSEVLDLYTGGAQIADAEGNTVTIQGADGTVYVEGDSAYTITVNGVYSTEDHSGLSYVPGIGTVRTGEYTFDCTPDGIDITYVPTDLDGNVYEEAAYVEHASPVNTNVVDVVVNGQAVTTGWNVDGTVEVPLRAVAEALGGTVAWDNAAKAVSVTVDGRTESFVVGDEGSYVEDPGTTWVPLAMAQRLLGAEAVLEGSTLTF
jgi:hypothetical protein